jgi:hypothetical protein
MQIHTADYFVKARALRVRRPTYRWLLPLLGVGVVASLVMIWPRH